METEKKSDNLAAQKKYYKKKLEKDEEFKQSELKRWKEYNKNRYQTDKDGFKTATLQKLKDKYHNDIEFQEKRKAYNREYARRKKAEKAALNEATIE
jgi:hypothetical protein